MNIQETWLKIKNLTEDILREWGILLLVFFLSLASFGLGRLSALETARPPVTIYEAEQGAVTPKTQTASAARAVSTLQEGGKVVASKNGKAYYFPWCGGAARISEKNKVWFENEAAAKAAGYAPAKNCKGLE